MKNCKLEVIATNKNTNHLIGKTLIADEFSFPCPFVIAYINDVEHTVDVRSVIFREEFVELRGFIVSADKKGGRISLKYLS